MPTPLLLEISARPEWSRPSLTAEHSRTKLPPSFNAPNSCTLSSSENNRFLAARWPLSPLLLISARLVSVMGLSWRAFITAGDALCSSSSRLQQLPVMLPASNGPSTVAIMVVNRLKGARQSFAQVVLRWTVRMVRRRWTVRVVRRSSRREARSERGSAWEPKYVQIRTFREKVLV